MDLDDSKYIMRKGERKTTEQKKHYQREVAVSWLNMENF